MEFYAREPDALLTPEEAARVLNVSPRCLENWRIRSSDGPPFVRISGRCVRYRRSDLQAWIEARLRASTADRGAAAEAA